MTFTPHSADGVILLTSGIACAAVLFDLAGRYFFSRKAKDSVRNDHKEVQTDAGQLGADDGQTDVEFPDELRRMDAVPVFGSTQTGEDSGYRSVDVTDHLPDHTNSTMATPNDVLKELYHATQADLSKVKDNVPETEGEEHEEEDLFNRINKKRQQKEHEKEEGSPECSEGGKWLNFERLLSCANVHSKHAAAHTAFYNECEEMKQTLVAVNDYVKRSYSEAHQSDDQVSSGSGPEDSPEAHESDEQVSSGSGPEQSQSPPPEGDTGIEITDEKLAELHRLLEALETLDENLNDLSERSREILPLHLRKQPLEEHLPATLVCDIQPLNLKTGDEVTLEDNADLAAWKSRTKDGDEIQLPSLCYVIPPPDNYAVAMVDTLREGLALVIIRCVRSLRPQLLSVCHTQLLEVFNKRRMIAQAVTSDTRQQCLEDLRYLDVAFVAMFEGKLGYEQLRKVAESLETALEKARVSYREDPRMSQDIRDPIRQLCGKVGLLMSLQKKEHGAPHEQLEHGAPEKQLQHAAPQKQLQHGAQEGVELSDEWVTDLTGEEEVPEESEVTQIVDPEMETASLTDSMSISVQSQATEVSEASSFTSSTGELRQTFTIRAIIDARDFSEISIAEATSRGILDPEKGIYRHPVSGKELPIPVAMTAGLIVVDSTKSKRVKGQTHEVGLVTVKVTRETKPYTVLSVCDPETDEQIPVSVAVEKRIFDPENGHWINADKGEVVRAQDAIDTGLLIVEYDEQVEESEPEVTTRTFAVYGVLDRRTNKRYPFDEACKRNLVSRDDGEFNDTRTGERHSVLDAAKQGWVKIRTVSEEDLELDQLVNRDRTDSLESSHSTASLT